MVIQTLLIATIKILDMLINAYIWLLIIGALLSFVQPNINNPIVQTINRLTYPAFDFVRRFIPTTIGAIDLAPLIVVIALEFIRLGVVPVLFNLIALIGF